MAAAESRLTELYDLGIGESYDFNTVVKLLNDELETDIEPVYVDNPIPEWVYVHDTMASIEKIGEDVGWEPPVSFEERLSESVGRMRRNKKR